jgi:hypothetical protein
MSDIFELFTNRYFEILESKKEEQDIYKGKWCAIYIDKETKLIGSVICKKKESALNFICKKSDLTINPYFCDQMYTIQQPIRKIVKRINRI